ncbi:hypothetical protein EYZ11_007767 [Aspergillus tanneri]|uniref:Gamma interferon inducible lysosomal thiol reductase n=1 Tax=Aspergillus tanneri TaxID=1220188 RepID=A0A4S3JC56_9EURO|nr:uncharacterized protein ATNIH1004_004156 [Aspergillus tanneri]KAA8648272.1 hypothetical protein ATNIH1004_004156 [Aspergillus tanneri]THC92749.1 hypothetical protein EYZ11_007767 [Aspergillus tanneri]
MEEKQPFLSQAYGSDDDDNDVETLPSTDSSRRCSRRGRQIITMLPIALNMIPMVLLGWLLIAAITPGVNFLNCQSLVRRLFYGLPEDAELLSEPTRVPLEAHIMSKCPDAQYCLKHLVVPAMEQISDKVDFDLSFIANVSDTSSDIQCKHGPGECIGNMLILCAENLPFPEGSDFRMPTIRSLGFSNCLIDSYHDIPDRALVEHCALEHGIDFNALNRCASKQQDDPDAGLSGLALLRESALHSADLGVKTSCTVRLDESIWCVRDGGVWKDCVQDGEGSKASVLVDEVKKLWKRRNK